MTQPIRFLHRYQKGYQATSVPSYLTDDEHPSYERIYQLAADFHTKSSNLAKINHMIILFRELILQPYLLQTNWKFNCSIKLKIEEFRKDVTDFMEDKKRYRQIQSILGAIHDKAEYEIVKQTLRDIVIRRQEKDAAFRELTEVMNQLEKIVDEAEKAAFTLKLLKENQICVISQ